MRPESPGGENAQHHLRVEITEKGRSISFEKDCLEPVSIRRRINNQHWEQVAVNARAPFVDTDPFEEGTRLDYEVAIGSTKLDASVKL